MVPVDYQTILSSQYQSVLSQVVIVIQLHRIAPVGRLGILNQGVLSSDSEELESEHHQFIIFINYLNIFITFNELI